MISKILVLHAVSKAWPGSSEQCTVEFSRPSKICIAQVESRPVSWCSDIHSVSWKQIVCKQVQRACETSQKGHQKDTHAQGSCEECAPTRQWKRAVQIKRWLQTMQKNWKMEYFHSAMWSLQGSFWRVSYHGETGYMAGKFKVNFTARSSFVVSRDKSFHNSGQDYRTLQIYGECSTVPVPSSFLAWKLGGGEQLKWRAGDVPHCR